MKDVQSMIFSMIAEAASVDTQLVNRDTTIRSLGVASLDAIEMLFKIEERFDVVLAERDVNMAVATAGMLVEAVERALSQNPAKPLAAQAG